MTRDDRRIAAVATSLQMVVQEELVETIRRRPRILLFTGAGISTDSGIPDYRGPQGLWRTETPVCFEGFVRSSSERLRYWRQKAAVWPLLRDARPNAVHTAIVDLERAGKWRWS